MRKFLNLKSGQIREGRRVLRQKNSLVVIGLILVISAALLGASALALEKDKTVSAVWGVSVLPYSPNLISSVSGHLFKTESGKSLVQVKTWYNRALRAELTQIQLYVYENSPSLLSFPGADAGSFDLPGDGSGCGFPSPAGQLSPPDCLENFLGLFHPQLGYDHVYLIFTVYGNIEDLPLNTRSQISEGAVSFFVWTYDRCDEGEHKYDHSVDAKVLSLTAGPNGGGYFITRTATNRWVIDVVDQEFETTEWYCEISKTVNPKNGRITTTSTRHEPLKAVIPLSYSIELFKNPE
jgi:hypothetical protein